MASKEKSAGNPEDIFNNSEGADVPPIENRARSTHWTCSTYSMGDCLSARIAQIPANDNNVNRLLDNFEGAALRFLDDYDKLPFLSSPIVEEVGRYATDSVELRKEDLVEKVKVEPGNPPEKNLKVVGFNVRESLRDALERAANTRGVTVTALARDALGSTVRQQRRPVPIGERVPMSLKLPEAMIAELDALIAGSGVKRAEFIHDELERYVGRLQFLGEDEVCREEPDPTDLTVLGTPRVRRKWRSAADVGGDPRAPENRRDLHISGVIPRRLHENFLTYVRNGDKPNVSRALAEAIVEFLTRRVVETSEIEPNSV